MSASYTFNKRVPPPSVLLQLRKPLSINTTVMVTDKEDTAISELAVLHTLVHYDEHYVCCSYSYIGGVDYYSGPYPVTFIAGHTTAIVEVAVRDDAISEKTEYFNLTIDPLSLPSSISVGDPCETTIIIIDDDSK